MDAGDIALIVLAAFWGVLVFFLALVSVNLFRVLDSTKGLLDGLRKETIPLLSEVRTTVISVNRELERVDSIVGSAANISRSAERVTGVVEQAISNPLIKAVSFAAGAQRALKRFRGDS